MATSESYPMVGGSGLYTYARNSDIQKGSIVGTKLKLLTAIHDNLDVPKTLSISTRAPYRIVDLGCSVGPNTFVAVNDIIQAIKTKYQKTGQTVNEFQIFFSDHNTDDFNALFTNLPPDRRYFVAGVPGSFHTRLFPEKSLDFVYSSNSLHWLSSIPKELNDPKSPAFNKGRIYYTNAPEAVGDAYSVQFAKDFESFISARAAEMVPGGLMVLIFSGRPNGTIPTKASFGPFFFPLESCLVEMADEGLLSKSKIDSFNLPIHHPSLDELTLIIEKNGCFDIKEMEASLPECVPYKPMEATRSGFEGLLASHFGKEIIDEIFDRYAKKIDGLPPLKKAPEAVGDAYSVQFAKDFESFISARAAEMVPGGLMVLIFSGRPNGTIPTKASFGPFFFPLESCLVEMADEGLLSKSKIDSFNLPIHHPSLDELTLIIEKNGCFDIKEMEASLPECVPYKPMEATRSGFEGLLASHFGKEIIDEIFDRYAKKIDGLPPLKKADGLGSLLFVALKRKPS